MNPWIIVGFLVALALAAAGGYARGDHDGKLSEHDQWVTREAALNADAAKKIKEAADSARAEERSKAEKQAQISTDLQAKLQEAENEKNRLAADVRAGKRKLSISARCPPRGDPKGAVAAPSGGRDGETRAELPVEASDFLIGLATEADNLARQLSACQAVILSDRVTP